MFSLVWQHSHYTVCWPLTFSGPPRFRFCLWFRPTIHVESPGIISVVNWHYSKCWHDLVLRWAASLFINSHVWNYHLFITVVAVQSTARGTFCVCVATPVRSDTHQNTLSLYFLCANSHRCAVGLPDTALFLAQPAVCFFSLREQLFVHLKQMLFLKWYLNAQIIILFSLSNSE